MPIVDTFDLSKLETELTIDEGRRASPYHDSQGHPTVGIGHNLDAGPLPHQTYPMTDTEVDGLFASDIAATVAKLDAYLPWWRTLDPVRQRVMINMTFNLGIGHPGSKSGLLSFNRFLYFVQAGTYTTAAQDLVGTLWAKQVGKRATRLEAMMASGSDVPNTAPLPPAAPLNPLPPALPPQATPPIVPYPTRVVPVPAKPAAPAKPVYNNILENILEAIIRFLERKVSL